MKQKIKDCIDSIRVLYSMMNKNLFHIFHRESNDKIEYVIEYRRSQLEVVRSGDPLDLDDSGYPVIKFTFDFITNKIYICTKFYPCFREVTNVFGQIKYVADYDYPVDIEEKYLQINMLPDFDYEKAIYDNIANMRRYIEHYFELNEDNLLKIQLLFNVFATYHIDHIEPSPF